jgi:xanthine dehydrogenase YagR molybdenum-binding subunit
MSIGQPLPRLDGRIKVTGSARYAADQPAVNLLHAVLITSTIPAGRVTEIDAIRALKEEGVARVITHAEMPRLAKLEAPLDGPPLAQTFIPMQGDAIHYEGQPLALVLGETLEAAEAGAQSVVVRYAPREPLLPAPPEWTAIDAAAIEPKQSGFLFWEPELVKGDVDVELDRAEHRAEATYLQPTRHHNALEPSAVLAIWDGDGLTLYDSTQHVYGVQRVVSALLGLPVEKVRVIAAHTGGGFGVKGWVWPHQVLAAMAAQLLSRPVKLVLSRANLYSCLGYQPRIAHHMKLGADRDGRLRAIVHDVVNLTSMTDDFVEFSAEASKSLYAARSLRTRQRVERANVCTPTPMRAPVEGPGLWALESAMDELAHEIGMDPLDLRLVNDAERDPVTDQPWSSKKLREAYEDGAELFGWRERPREPRRDGEWLVGQGMASCLMGTFRNPSPGADVHLQADGTARVETGTQDIGTGTLTIFPQIAADVLGLPVEKVGLRMGDTRLPEAGPTYGSSSTMCVGAAVLQAAQDARAKLARLVQLSPHDVEMVGGTIRRRGASDGRTIVEAMREAGVDEIVGTGSFDPSQHGTGFSMRAFGAIFVEVAVDPELGLLRLRRAVGSYSAGRIINPRTARSQMTGGIVWGWGMAAMERSQHDPVLGRFLSKDLAGVVVPVHADIPSEIMIHFVDEVDELASPLGARGIGELGATGVAAAVANAVFHATGKRIRELPITPSKLIDV